MPSSIEATTDHSQRVCGTDQRQRATFDAYPIRDDDEFRTREDDDHRVHCPEKSKEPKKAIKNALFNFSYVLFFVVHYSKLQFIFYLSTCLLWLSSFSRINTIIENESMEEPP